MSNDIRTQYFKEIRDDRGLPKDEMIELATKAKAGDIAAQNKLVKNNLLLVVKIAREYMNNGVSLDDLIQEGNVGLITAVSKFKPSTGASFTTCAQYWIRAGIIRNCMHNNRTVKLPEHVSELMRTDRWKGANYSQVSIDKPNDEGDSMADDIKDQRIADPFVDEEALILRQKVGKFLGKLNKQETEVIKMFYGIDRDFNLKVEEIAEHFELTTTRINQILRSGMKKMKSEAETQLGVVTETIVPSPEVISQN